MSIIFTDSTSLHDTDATAGDGVAKAFATADEYKRIWATTRLGDRQLLLENFTELVLRSHDDISVALQRDTGVSADAAATEIRELLDYVPVCIGQSNAFYGHVYPAAAEANTDSLLQYTVHEPLGTVAIVMDAQKPVSSFAYQVISTLLVGNVVLLHSDPDVHPTVELLSRLLHDAGIPSEALQLIAGGFDAARELADIDPLNGLSVHGTTDEVTELTRIARKHLTRVVAIGDSNDAMVVLDREYLSAAIDDVVSFTFAPGNTRRAVPQRIILAADIAKDFHRELVNRIQETTSSPLKPEHVKQARETVESFVESGASLLSGPGKDAESFAPTVVQVDDPQLRQVPPLLAPVVFLTEARDDDHALELANAAEHGIVAAVYSSDYHRIGTFVSGLEARVVSANGWPSRTPQLTWGGVKRSGVGTESAFATPVATTELKTISLADIYQFSSVNRDNTLGQHT